MVGLHRLGTVELDAPHGATWKKLAIMVGIVTNPRRKAKWDHQSRTADTNISWRACNLQPPRKIHGRSVKHSIMRCIDQRMAVSSPFASVQLRINFSETPFERRTGCLIHTNHVHKTCADY
jgi:hypothetical protein